MVNAHRILVVLALALGLAACGRSNLEKQNDELTRKAQSLSEQVVALQAENARLTQQVRLLTKDIDDLTETLKVQQGLAPAPAASPK
jgi:uncharacterized protein HemX